MNRYLLDTIVISELRKARPHGAVLSWVGVQDVGQLFLSAFTLGELQACVEKTRRQDPAKAGELNAWIEQLAASGQILPMDVACFREWGRLMEGKPLQLLGNAMIAATARVHDLIVATRNEADFRHLGVRIVNPFKRR